TWAPFIFPVTSRLRPARCISSSRWFGLRAVWMLVLRGPPLIRLGTYGSMDLKTSRSIFGSAKELWCRNQRLWSWPVWGLALSAFGGASVTGVEFADRWRERVGR